MITLLGDLEVSVAIAVWTWTLVTWTSFVYYKRTTV